MPNLLLIAPDATPQTFMALLEQIHAQRVTGQVLIVLHCTNGVARAADVAGTMTRVAFDGDSPRR